MPTQKLRIVCVSDTHNAAPGEGYTLPQGDILVHAGDLTNQGRPSEIEKAISWLEKTDFVVKIVVAGNHDLSLDERYPNQSDEATRLRKMIRESKSITYLEHESTTIELKGVKLKVFASPYSQASGEKKWAFQYSPDQATQTWSTIPPDTAFLVTHTPPVSHLDRSAHWTQGGCPALLAALQRTKPLLHVSGHCHEGRGGEIVRWCHDEAGPGHDVTESQWRDPGANNKKQSLFDLTSSKGGCALQAGEQTAIVNASITAKSYGRGAKAFNKPIVVDIELPHRA